MSVVKMKKVSLIALQSCREALLRELMWLSEVDVTPLDEREPDPEYADMLSSDSTKKEEDILRTRISALNDALDTLRPYGDYKRSLFTPRYELSRKQLEALDAGQDIGFSYAYRANELKNDIFKCTSQLNKLETKKCTLLPWSGYTLPMELTGTDNSSFFTGTVPASYSLDGLSDLSPTGFNDFYVEKINAADDRNLILAVCAKSDEEQLQELLSAAKFSPAPFKDSEGTPTEAIASCEKEAAQLGARIEKDKKELTSLAGKIPELEKLYDAETNALQLVEVRNHILKTGTCILLEGYLPEKSVPRLEKILVAFDCWYELSDPQPEEDVPVLLHNNALVTPFEGITEMYALPVYGGLDPNAAMAPFYFILFGMMFSDAGYGFIMALACALGLIFLKPKRNMKKTMTLFLFCGISTVFWGLMFGTVFGNSITVIAQTYLGLDYTFPALWFDPVSDPMTMLILSIIIGYVQIITSLVLKAVVAFRKKDWMGAVFDAGMWIVTLLGVGMIALGLVIPGIVGQIGTYVAIAGLVGLLLTQGREKKGFFGKLTGGLLSLYDSTGFLSDLLSYSRVLALGLSSGVIGQVFNTMGSLMGSGIGSFIFFLIIFCVGHALNFALSFLSAYVHASRLQFIEFFGRFYESGGRPYKPLAVDGKYSDITVESEVK